MSVDVPAVLAERRGDVEAALTRVLPQLRELVGEPALAPIEHSLFAGGKRLRPILCVEAYRAISPDTPPGDALFDLAVTLELIHTYSLMHDDLPCMDDAELRRGKPTAHTRFGVHSTTWSGAALIPGASWLAWWASGRLGCSEDARRAIVAELCRAAGNEGMVGGQALDLLAEGEVLTGDELRELHGRKTGALLTAALTLGAFAGGGGAREREALAAYGRAVGLAFQIADDILDRTSSAQDLGKNPSDQDHDKSTYVSLYGLERARELAGAERDRAVQALRGGGIDAPVLEALASYVVERGH